MMHNSDVSRVNHHHSAQYLSECKPCTMCCYAKSPPNQSLRSQQLHITTWYMVIRCSLAHHVLMKARATGDPFTRHQQYCKQAGTSKCTSPASGTPS
jgi:hypothetical protein